MATRSTFQSDPQVKTVAVKAIRHGWRFCDFQAHRYIMALKKGNKTYTIVIDRTNGKVSK
jgi:hypothetical protein